MQLYQMHEAEFVLPGSTKDQSVNVFGFHSPDIFAEPMPGNDPPEFSVVISRDTVSESETLNGYVEQQIQAMRANVADFHLQGRQETFVDNLDVVICEYTWSSGNDHIYQRQAFLLCPSASSLLPNTRVAMTITGTTRESLQSRYEAMFQNLLYSLRFRR